MATTLIFLPGESRGQRSLVGSSPWGRKESDTTERLTHTVAHPSFRLDNSDGPAAASSTSTAPETAPSKADYSPPPGEAAQLVLPQACIILEKAQLVFVPLKNNLRLKRAGRIFEIN